MKKALPILTLFCLLALGSCIKDDIDNCSGKMHFHFSYIYGGVNRFFDMVKSDMELHFYHVGQTTKYRNMTVPRNSIGLQQALILEKTPVDIDSLELISWSTDPAIEYVTTPNTPIGEGYVRLKEITEGSGICRPVDDLFYGRVKFDADDRFQRNDVTIPYMRAVCRIRVTMIPQTVEINGGGMIEGKTTRTPGLVPNPGDYTFHISGTLSTIDDNNNVGGDEVLLSPECYYDETTGNVMTNWFGAFPSRQEEYLKVNVYIREEPVASFDCAPVQIASTAGDYVDLVIDGQYIKPVMEVRVNGWKKATVTSNM